MNRKFMLVVLAALGVAVFSLTSQAEVYVGRKDASTAPLERIDHSEWNRLLQKYVNNDGRVDYRSWHRNAADRRALEKYLGHLSSGATGSTTDRNAQLAFWINAYNAVTVHGILNEYPTTSIRNHTARLFGYNIWKHLQLYVDGRPYSLNHIEHEILRKMHEPRIHFAIVCASIGCPRLLNEAYTADRVQEQLEANALDFFSRSQNFQYRNGEFALSSILDWFGEDFGSSQSQQLTTISAWLPPGQARQAAATGRGNVSYLDYDWNLNAQE